MFFCVKMISVGLFSIILCKQTTITRDEEVGLGGNAKILSFLSFSGKSVWNNMMKLDNYPFITWSFDLMTARRRCWPTVQPEPCL